MALFLASQLTGISSRFAVHVEEIREFLRKETLPVLSPDAIPQLLDRLGGDARFRADLASLMRAVLYREREQVGYEDLLGILVAAAAGTEQDLTGESQEASVREMLRFVLQSRRSTYRPEAEQEKASVEAEVREPAATVAEPALARGLPVAADSRRGEARFTGGSVAVAEEDSCEPHDVVLPLRGAGFKPVQPELFAAQTELGEPWWRVHSALIAGMVCLVLGVGAGLMIHRGFPLVDRHVGTTAGSSRSKPERSGSTATEGMVATTESASAMSGMGRSGRRPRVPERMDAAADTRGAGAGKAGAPVEAAGPVPVTRSGRGDVQPARGDVAVTSGVPVTVVKQVVRASADDEVEDEPTPTTAATHSIVPAGSAGIKAADVVYSPPPEYPAAASAAGVEGAVTVRAVVDPEGHVIYARAVSGPALLRDAATEAVQRWRYRPLLDNGRPIAVTTTAILDFRFAR